MSSETASEVRCHLLLNMADCNSVVKIQIENICEK